MMRRHQGQLAGAGRVGRLLALTFFAIAGLVLVAPTSSAVAANPYTVTLVLSQEGGVYSEFANSFEAAIGANASGADVHVRVVILRDWDAQLQQMPDMIVAVGTRASLQIAQDDHHPPLVVTLVPSLTYRTILESSHPTPGPDQPQMTAVYLDEPMYRYIALARAVVPELREIGVVLGPSSRRQREAVLAAARRFDLDTHIAEMTATEDSASEALDLALADSGAILALPDPAVYNRYTLPDILLTAFRYRVPVIGYSAAFTRAGAMASIYTSAAQCGTQAATMLLRARAADGVHLPPPAYPSEFEIDVNQSVARSLGRTLPDIAELKAQLRALDHGP